MLYKGMEDKDERKQLKKIYIQNELEKEKEKITKKEVIYPSSQPEENIPKCPTCGSTNIKRISGTKRWLTTGLFGLASSDIGKTMVCKNCGYKF